MADEFYWSKREMGSVYVCWLARPGSRKDFVSFIVAQDAGCWGVFYRPDEGARTACLARDFPNADGARAWAETIFKRGVADALWATAKEPYVYD